MSRTARRRPSSVCPWRSFGCASCAPEGFVPSARLRHLIRAGPRSTLSDVRNAITIRLDPELEKLLDRLCRSTGRTRSDLVREALRRQLSLLRFEQLRRQVLPFAEARGYLTDEDVARNVS